MRKLTKRASGWIHATLIIAIIIPLLYALSTDQQYAIVQTLYYKSLVIALPVILTDLAADRCKGLFSYLIMSLLIFIATAAVGLTVSGSMRHSTMLLAYLLLLLCETTVLIINRLIERLHKKKEAEAIKNEDPTWQPLRHTLREPAFPVLIYFLVVYSIALNLDCPPVCNAALFSAAVYVPVTFLYQYIDETEHYLALNKRTCNLPSKRIYGIGNGMLAIFLLLFMLMALPALFTVSNRHYRDLRKWEPDIEIDYVEPMPENTQDNSGEDLMAALLAEYGEPKPAPYWLILLSDIAEAAVFLFLGIMLLKMIRNTFRDFRGVNDENGDLVEELEEAREEASQIVMPASHRILTQKERIRKEYRKTIRRHRKDRPAPYESPMEIETNAGIADTAEGRELHRNYESARYGREE